jgi:cob(I)alamin adenosyltransferase
MESGSLRIVKIYTKTGDRGETGLFSGERVSKSHLLVEAYGTVDEANSLLGVALSHGLHPEVEKTVKNLQSLLFRLGADLATLPGKRDVARIDNDEITAMESEMDAVTAALPAIHHFILPGGNPGAASLQLARAVIRRAERAAIRAAEEFPISAGALILLNRLSDFLFLLARLENHLSGTRESIWEPEQPASSRK